MRQHGARALPRRPAFEALDFVTFALFAGAVALVSAVLGEGRYVWWTSAPWIGWALAAAIPLFYAALAWSISAPIPCLTRAGWATPIACASPW